MLFMMAIGLFTSRVILNALVVSDMGLMSVASSVIMMFTFLNATLASGTQRFISYAIGENNVQRLRAVFKSAMTLHLLLAINSALYAEALTMPFESIACYVDKDQLLDDKSEEDASKGTGTKLSPLNLHLHKIELCIQLYLNKDYNEFMRSTSIKQIVRARQKNELREGIDSIVSLYNDMAISEVIDLADSLGICVKDDKVNSYIDNNPYLWRRIKEVSYKEARNVYNYRMGNKPFSTQHKTKGLEYNNVLVILKSNWSNYDFASLFYDNKKKDSIVERTKKLFYVCCIRAKENLVVYYPTASNQVIEGAKVLFGDKNVHRL